MNGVSKYERGIFALWFAVLAPVIIAAFALALETIYLFTKQHRQQLATDMAVTSAGLQLLREDPDGALAAAEVSLETHGIEAQDVELQLTEDEIGQSYRLTVTSTPLQLLTRFLSEEQFSLVTQASVRVQRSACLLALAPSGTGLSIANNGSVIGDTCNAQIDSTSLGPANAAVVIGNKATVALHSIRTVGGASVSGNASVTPPVVTGVAVMGDPLLEMPEPAFTGCDYNNIVVKGVQTLSPGTYCGGIEVNASATANLSPGNYVLYQGDLTSKRNATIQGEGVTLFLLGGGLIALDPTTLLDVTAPSSDSYAGVLLFESRSASLDVNAHTIPLLKDSTVDGLLYTPNSTLNVTVDSANPANAAALSASIIAYRITLAGPLTFPADEAYLATGMGQRVWLSE